MAVNYTTKYANKIAERFRRASVTNAACGNDYSFVGAKTVKVYSVDTAAETDYNRNAAGNRFGEPKNLGDSVQELMCEKAAAFTFVIDALNSSDQAIERAAGKALRRQLDEVTIPNMDRYRLRKWCLGANILRTLAAPPTKDTIIENIIDLNAAMTDALVPLENRTLYIPTAQYRLLKRNPDFINIQALGQTALEKGIVGEVDGCAVIPVPKGYLPDGAYFLIKHKSSTADPVKLSQYDVLEKVQGYSGPVVQGVTYYDSFVLAAKCDGLAVCGSGELILAAPEITKSGSTVSIAAVNGVTFHYTLDGTHPRYSSSAQIYTNPVTLEPEVTFRAVSVKENCCGQEASVTA